ncbi:MAG TPA: hypothetical protein VFX79_02840 [Candidatus Saccharimonadales bacterium]|nr:hypothetical protein [Candidatus Saccharimonadales bacterium]
MEKIARKSFLPILLALSVVSLVLLTSSVSAISPPKDTKSGSSLKQRITQRKKERGIKLDEVQRIRFESVCQISQTNIRNLRDSYVPIADKRSKAYNQVDAKLWVIIGGLKYIEFDTFGLEQQRTELLNKINHYENLYDQFNEVLDDAVNMNCKADVVGFKAMVETARIYNIQIRDQLNDITNFTNDKVRQTLAGITETLRVRASE